MYSYVGYLLLQQFLLLFVVKPKVILEEKVLFETLVTQWTGPNVDIAVMKENVGILLASFRKRK